MASKTDGERAAIRERKMEAQRRLREQLDAQERLQNAVFDEYDKLARIIDSLVDQLTRDDIDTFKRVEHLTNAAAELPPQLESIRKAAATLTTHGGMSKSEVADLLGTPQAGLFPRRSGSRRADNRHSDDGPRRGQEHDHVTDDHTEHHSGDGE